jgi:hypothetical protein
MNRLESKSLFPAQHSNVSAGVQDSFCVSERVGSGIPSEGI